MSRTVVLLLVFCAPQHEKCCQPSKHWVGEEAERQVVNFPLEGVTPKPWREATSTYPQQAQQSPRGSFGEEVTNKPPNGPAGKSSGGAESLGRVESGWQRWWGAKNLSHRTSGVDILPTMWTPTLSVPGAQEQHRDFPRIYLSLHYLFSL